MWYEDVLHFPSLLLALNSSLHYHPFKFTFSMRDFQRRNYVQMTLPRDPLHPSVSGAWIYP